MKKIKKVMAVGMICLGLCATNITAYARQPEALPFTGEEVSVTSTTPACPRCHTNKWVVPHGLVSWACLNCNYNFW